MRDLQPTPLGEQSTLASTKGWDTVYAIQFQDVNKAIRDHASTPPGFESPPVTMAGDRIDGSFSHWRLTGGEGRLVHMALPVPAGFLREYDASLTETGTVERHQMTFTIEVQLSCLPQPEDEMDTLRAAAPGVPHAIKLHMPKMKGPFGASVVRVIDCVYPENPGTHTQPSSDDDEANKELFMQYMAEWLNDSDNLGKFNHTFAVVNINEKASKDAFHWLMPKYVSYGVMAGDTEDTSVFAILCLTEEVSAERPIPDSQEISPNIIPPGETSAFLISKERFMRKLLYPNITSTFCPPADLEYDPKIDRVPVYPNDFFEFAASGSLLRNTRPIVMPNFQGRDEDEITEAHLGRNGLNLVFEDTYIDIRYEEFTHPFWWFWYEAVHNFSVHVGAGLNDYGRFILTPPDDADDEDVSSHEAVLTKTSAAQAIDDVLLALDIILILAAGAKLGWGLMKGGAKTATATGATVSGQIAKSTASSGAAAIKAGEATTAAGATAIASGKAAQPASFFARNLARIHTGLIAGMTGALAADRIIQVVAENDDWAKNRIPHINEFAAAVMAPITWPGASDFEVTAATFNGSFQISGDPKFPVTQDETHA